MDEKLSFYKFQISRKDKGKNRFKKRKTWINTLSERNELIHTYNTQGLYKLENNLEPT